MSAKKKKSRPRFTYRNAGAPRAPRSKADDKLTTGQRIMYTLAGAGASTLTGSLAARQGWAPTTIALMLGGAGAALAVAGKNAAAQTAGTGALAAAGGELGLLLSTERLSKAAADRQRAENKRKADEDKRKADEKAAAAKSADGAASKRPSNAEAIPPEVMESALERARHRLAMVGR